MKINKNKGFTVAEIITTLAVISIIVAFTGGLLVAVFNITTKQQNVEQCNKEFNNSCEMIDNFLNNYNTDIFSLYQVESQNGISIIKITDNINEYSLTYNKSLNKINAQFYNYQSQTVEDKELSLEKLKNIIFTNENNLIKCEFEFEDIYNLTKLFTFGVE